jgi:peptidoglycan/LPS O-acetylase OafA/YrhL
MMDSNRKIDIGTFLNPFRRITSSGKFISEIDGLRFIAIGTVVLFHLVVNLAIKSPESYAIPAEGNLLTGIALHGFHGVELFFIISGFILAFPFASYYVKQKEPVRLKQYFLRRLTRLEPPYVICMISLFILLVLFNHKDAGVLFPHLAASLFYLHNIVYGSENVINNVAWSLEIEVQFYMLVPILSLVFAVRDTLSRRAIIVGACLLVVVCRLLFIQEDSTLHLTILAFLHFFLIGFLLADVFLVNWNENPAKGLRWDLVSLIGWPALFLVWNLPNDIRTLPWMSNQPILPTVFFPVSAFFLYVAAFRGRYTNVALTNPWVTSIGGMCYTIYLFHNKLIGIFISYSKGLAPFSSYTLNVLVQGALVLPPMLALCAVYFVLIEKPCMRKDWPKRFAFRLRTVLLSVSERLKTRVDT